MELKNKRKPIEAGTPITTQTQKSRFLSNILAGSYVGHPTLASSLRAAKRINRLPEWAKKQRSECFSKTNYWKDRTWRWKVLYARCPGYNHQNSWVYGKLEKINNKINISAKRLFHKKIDSMLKWWYQLVSTEKLP